MFSQFSQKYFSQSQKMRGKDQRLFIQQLERQYPAFREMFADLAKQQLTLFKTPNRFQFIAVNGQLQYFNYYDGTWMPMLRLLHKYPQMVPHIVADRGACRAVMDGAALMAPGVTSVPDGCQVGQIYAVRFQDAEAFAYVKLSQGPQDIMKEGRKDPVGEIVMLLGDPLWETGDKVKV